MNNAQLDLTINSGNAAFADNDAGSNEIARLLRQTADRIESGADCGTLLDYNGNKCGEWSFEPYSEDD